MSRELPLPREDEGQTMGRREKTVIAGGKQFATARIKGPGMPWHINDLNALLALRCVFLERSWQTHRPFPARLAA